MLWTYEDVAYRFLSLNMTSFAYSYSNIKTKPHTYCIQFCLTHLVCHVYVHIGLSQVCWTIGLRPCCSCLTRKVCMLNWKCCGWCAGSSIEIMACEDYDKHFLKSLSLTPQTSPLKLQVTQNRPDSCIGPAVVQFYQVPDMARLLRHGTLKIFSKLLEFCHQSTFSERTRKAAPWLSATVLEKSRAIPILTRNSTSFIPTGVSAQDHKKYHERY